MIKKFLILTTSSLLGFILGLSVPVNANDMQAPFIISSAQAQTCKVQFDQDAPDLATAQAYQYQGFIDGSSTPVTIIATCSGTSSPFLCETGLPTSGQSNGSHTLALKSNILLSDGTTLPSSLSVSYAYLVVGPPATPKNLRIRTN